MYSLKFSLYFLGFDSLLYFFLFFRKQIRLLINWNSRNIAYYLHIAEKICKIFNFKICVSIFQNKYLHDWNISLVRGNFLLSFVYFLFNDNNNAGSFDRKVSRKGNIKATIFWKIRHFKRNCDFAQYLTYE